MNPLTWCMHVYMYNEEASTGQSVGLQTQENFSYWFTSLFMFSHAASTIVAATNNNAEKHIKENTSRSTVF